jgi:hypothetical protein
VPDPIEELENFHVPGPPMTPLPAPEVRRRGTRLRRRNHALAAVGGLAVVAAIATPFAVFAGHQTSSTPDPAPKVEWIQEIPTDFPLSNDMPGQSLPEVTDESGLDDIVLCGTTVWSPGDPVGTVDIAGAQFGPMEEQADRTLALYADDRTAAQALAAIRSGVEDCPRDENGGGAPLVQQRATADLGGDDSYAFIQRAKDGDFFSQLSLWEIVRTGNALYLDYSYGAVGDDTAVQAAEGAMTNRSEKTRAALCVFSATGCGSTVDQGVDDGGAPATTIPGDFDLLAGLPESRDDRFQPEGPDKGMEDIDLTACSQAPPQAATIDRLRVDYVLPEGLRQRQLMVFPDTDDAEAWLAAAADSFLGCEIPPSNGVVGRYDLTGSPLGESARTVTLRYLLDGEPAMGHEVIELVRVGAAVLVARTGIDTDSEPVTDDALADFVATSRTELTPVVDGMCIYAADGC